MVINIVTLDGYVPVVADDYAVTISGTSGWYSPVSDRTDADCVYGISKGCIDATTLNRIENNIAYIKNYIERQHIQHGIITTNSTIWERTFYVKYADFSRIQSAILNIRATGIIRTGTPIFSINEPGKQITFETLNSMEKVLDDIKVLLDGMCSIKCISGTFALGSNIRRQQIRR